VLGAELAAEREELFVDQRLDRTGVNRAFAGAERLVEQRRGDERFSRAGGRIQDDITTGVEFEDGLLLLRVGFEAALGERLEKPVHDRVGAGPAGERGQWWRRRRLRGHRASKSHAGPEGQACAPGNFPQATLVARGATCLILPSCHLPSPPPPPRPTHPRTADAGGRIRWPGCCSAARG